MRKFFFILTACLACFISLQAQINKQYVPCNDIPNIMQAYYADVTALNRVYFVEGSPERRERYKKLALDYLDTLAPVAFASLPQGCKADYVLFRRDLKEVVFQSDMETKDNAAIEKWFPFADSIYALEKVRRRGGAVDARKVASNFSSVAKQLIKLQAALKSRDNITVSNSRRAVVIISGLQAAAKNIFTFYNEYDPLFTWWVPGTYKAFDSALAKYAVTFQEVAYKNAPNKDSSGIVGYPIGRDELVRQLASELVDYTPEELMEIAKKEFAWCDQEMLKASTEMGFGKDWKKALEKVKQSYVPAGEQPQAMVKLYNESIAFLKAKDLITIPKLAEETWRMAMLTPKQQLLNPFFSGGEEFDLSYPTNTMTFDERMMSMRGNNPHFFTGYRTP